MACTTTSVLHCITLAVLLFLATTSPKANALSIRANVLGLKVGGTARCSTSVTGNNPSTSAPLANVTIVTTLRDQPIGSAITNRVGSFQTNLNNLPNIEIENNVVEGLNVMIPLPILECPIWANVTTGRLQANVTLPSLSSVVNGILNLRLTSMIRVI